MEFIDVRWRHNIATEPIRLVSELDDERYETRKLEFFSDGRVGYASSDSSLYGTLLGDVPVPPLAEINSDPEFSGAIISAGEFETLWKQHAKTT